MLMGRLQFGGSRLTQNMRDLDSYVREVESGFSPFMSCGLYLVKPASGNSVYVASQIPLF